jgi:hypothetical protein
MSNRAKSIAFSADTEARKDVDSSTLVMSCRLGSDFCCFDCWLGWTSDRWCPLTWVTRFQTLLQIITITNVQFIPRTTLYHCLVHLQNPLVLDIGAWSCQQILNIIATITLSIWLTTYCSSRPLWFPKNLEPVPLKNIQQTCTQFTMTLQTNS